VSSILPTLGAETVAIDGKTSRRSGGVDATALHLVSAFAAGAGLVLGQRATREKSNEITAIPELLSTLALAGCTVTIDAIGAQTGIAELIQDRGADYVLAVKDNQLQLAESIRDFWRTFRAHSPEWTHHSFAQTVEKDHGRWPHRSFGKDCAASSCSKPSGRPARLCSQRHACTSAAWLPTPSGWHTPSALTGRWRIDSTGLWM